MIKPYLMLTKPGIILGNIITTVGGFFLASKGTVDYGLLLATLIGLSLVIASAGVFNNYMDQHHDAKMERTKNRALVLKQITSQNACLFAVFLGFLGFLCLIQYTNLLTVFITLLGFLIYVIVYAFLKSRTVHGTIVGSLAGAVPPVIGYCAVTGEIDSAALLLFLILIFWQMPHFFAISLYHLKDYQTAAIQILPVVKGMQTTKRHMLGYLIAFIISSCMLTALGYTSLLFFLIAALLGIVWIVLFLRESTYKDTQRWGRLMFRFSLVVIISLFVAMSMDPIALT